jgi:hypothetical protein
MAISLKDYRRQGALALNRRTPRAKPEDGFLSGLGDMSPAEYGLQRQAIADRTGIPLKYLDAEHDLRRKSVKNEGSKTIERSYWRVEPWPEPVDGATLIDQIQMRLKRHVVMSNEAALAAALWSVFAWAHDAAVHSPLLLVSSPEAECGKPGGAISHDRVLAPHADCR